MQSSKIRLLSVLCMSHDQVGRKHKLSTILLKKRKKERIADLERTPKIITMVLKVSRRQHRPLWWCMTYHPRGRGYFRNFWVGMCRRDPGTLHLYQSYFSWILLPYTRCVTPYEKGQKSAWIESLIGGQILKRQCANCTLHCFFFG